MPGSQLVVLISALIALFPCQSDELQLVDASSDSGENDCGPTTTTLVDSFGKAVHDNLIFIQNAMSSNTVSSSESIHHHYSMRRPVSQQSEEAEVHVPVANRYEKLLVGGFAQAHGVFLSIVSTGSKMTLAISSQLVNKLRGKVAKDERAVIVWIVILTLVGVLFMGIAGYIAVRSFWSVCTGNYESKKLNQAKRRADEQIAPSSYNKLLNKLMGARISSRPESSRPSTAASAKSAFSEYSDHYEHGPLCQELVVQAKQGLKLAVFRRSRWYDGGSGGEQVEEIEIHDVRKAGDLLVQSRTAVGVQKSHVMLCLSDGATVAYLECQDSTRQNGIHDDDRRIYIFSSDPNISVPFAVAIPSSQHLMAVRRISRGLIGARLLKFVAKGRGSLILLDGDGKVVAGLKENEQAARASLRSSMDEQPPAFFLDLANGADTALIICAIISALKLGALLPTKLQGDRVAS